MLFAYAYYIHWRMEKLIDINYYKFSIKFFLNQRRLRSYKLTMLNAFLTTHEP